MSSSRAHRHRHHRDPATRARRAERREELLDAAVRVIRRDGPSASMDRMAAEAGVTKPILYRHFGDRRGLVAALALRFAADLQNTLQEALAHADLEPRDLLVAGIDAYLAFVERDPNVYRFVVQRAMGEDPEAHVAVAAYLNHVGSEVAVIVGEALRAQGLDSGPAEPWGFGIVGMVHLAGDWWLERPVMTRPALVSYLADLLWTGLSGAGLRAPAAGVPTAVPPERAN